MKRRAKNTDSQDKMRRIKYRNWIICGLSLAAAFFAYKFVGK